MNTVKQARQNGFKVRVCHYRPCKFNIGDNKKELSIIRYSRKHSDVIGAEPLPKGGMTVVTITKNGKSYQGVAVCSMKDAFCYSSGSRIALDRAIAQHQESTVKDKEEKINFKYYNMNNIIDKFQPSYLEKSIKKYAEEKTRPENLSLAKAIRMIKFW